MSEYDAATIDTDAEPVIDAQKPAAAHRVSDRNTIEKDPNMIFRRVRAGNKLDMFVARIVARNFEVVETWKLTGNGTLHNVKTEWAYNYSTGRWEQKHTFDHEFSLTSDGHSLEHEPDKTLAEYCRERAEKTVELRFQAFEF